MDVWGCGSGAADAAAAVDVAANAFDLEERIETGNREGIWEGGETSDMQEEGRVGREIMQVGGTFAY